MCGGVYKKWETPRQLLKINGETIVGRTIRLLKECGINDNDIIITSNDDRYMQFGLQVWKHRNSYIANGLEDIQGYWFDAFYPTSMQVCYLMGDVIYSRCAIKTIIETDTNDIELFASAPPFPENYCKGHAEPFALKVVNQKHFRRALDTARVYAERGLFARKPIMWELWQVIKNTPLNEIDFTNYTVINDYTCDIDNPEDIEVIKSYINKEWLE